MYAVPATSPAALTDGAWFDVAASGPDVDHPAVGVKKRPRRGIARRIGRSEDPAQIVDRIGGTAAAAQRSEITHRAVAVDERVKVLVARRE